MRHHRPDAEDYSEYYGRYAGLVPDGDITMAEAKKLVAGRMTLGGNVQARTLEMEDEEATERATRAAFEGGKERFILRPTEGPSPVISEREFRNWMTMIDVWEELSAIP